MPCIYIIYIYYALLDTMTQDIFMEIQAAQVYEKSTNIYIYTYIYFLYT